MDIKKEREAFEEYISNLGLVEFDEWNFKLDECEEYLHEPTNISWGIWRQKQSEIDELKAAYSGVNAKLREQLNINSRLQENLLGVDSGEWVIVPKEPTPKMIDATWNFDEEIQDMSHNSRNEFIYKAMIEAAQGEGHE